MHTSKKREAANSCPGTELRGRKLQFRSWQSRQEQSRQFCKGQALAELTIGLIAFAVLFLGLLLVGQLCRARVAAILEARATVGSAAIQGQLLSDSALFYGSAAASEDLQTSVLSPMETPIAYSQYRPGTYAYMQDNLVATLQGGTLVGAFTLVQDDAVRTVTNDMFLVRMGVGSEFITIRQPVCLPKMTDFP
jgi:hypothetical protein